MPNSIKIIIANFRYIAGSLFFYQLLFQFLGSK